MRIVMQHIALVCAMTSLHPNGSCQICCETDYIKVCKFHQKCTKDLEEDGRKENRNPIRSNLREKISSENR